MNTFKFRTPRAPKFLSLLDTPNPTNENRVKLRICNLNDNTDRNDLNTYLSSVVAPIYVTVIKDSIERTPRGFGYATYASIDDAKRVRKELNYKNLQGNQIEINILRKWNEYSIEQMLVVKKLPVKYTSNNFYDLIEGFGETEYCRLEVDEEGNCLGKGMCRFVNVESVQEAVRKLNGQKLEDEFVVAKVFESREMKLLKDRRTLHLSELPSTWNKNKTLKEFAKFGDIIMIQKNKVRFHNYKDALRAHDAFVNLDSPNQPKVQFYLSNFERKNKRELEKRNRKHGNCLFLKGIKSDICENEIKRIFSKYGKDLIVSKTSKKYSFGREPVELYFAVIFYKRTLDLANALQHAEEDEEVMELVDLWKATRIGFLNHYFFGGMKFACIKNENDFVEDLQRNSRKNKERKSTRRRGGRNRRRRERGGRERGGRERGGRERGQRRRQKREQGQGQGQGRTTGNQEQTNYIRKYPENDRTSNPVKRRDNKLKDKTSTKRSDRRNCKEILYHNFNIKRYKEICFVDKKESGSIYEFSVQ